MPEESRLDRLGYHSWESRASLGTWSRTLGTQPRTPSPPKGRVQRGRGERPRLPVARRPGPGALHLDRSGRREPDHGRSHSSRPSTSSPTCWDADEQPRSRERPSGSAGSPGKRRSTPSARRPRPSPRPADSHGRTTSRARFRPGARWRRSSRLRSPKRDSPTSPCARSAANASRRCSCRRCDARSCRWAGLHEVRLEPCRRTSPRADRRTLRVPRNLPHRVHRETWPTCPADSAPPRHLVNEWTPS